MSEDKLKAALARHDAAVAAKREAERAEAERFRDEEQKAADAALAWEASEAELARELTAMNEQIANHGLHIAILGTDKGTDRALARLRYNLAVNGNGRGKGTLSINVNRFGLVQITMDDKMHATMKRLDFQAAEADGQRWRGLLIDFIDAATS